MPDPTTPTWRLVPEVPTREMIDAGAHNVNMNWQQGLGVIAGHCYRAMIAASPAPQELPPVQLPEPVAWYLPAEGDDDSMFRDHRAVVACKGNPWTGWTPLYTADQLRAAIAADRRAGGREVRCEFS